jgi:hypothetical protein
MAISVYPSQKSLSKGHSRVFSFNRSTIGFNGGYNFGKHIFSSISVNYVKSVAQGGHKQVMKTT